MGGEAKYVLQQIRFAPEQSSSDLHDLGQLFEQMPLQQSSPVEVQSLDCVHAFGHVSYAVLRHKPVAVREVSNLAIDVQQISP